ncbi:ABC transporter ATP-binding protein [Streptacidiphilus sp. PB12-B1b]|uniref:ABC transporter ATP-binding protein n=1 Tax=Streptacidiphilus sp. PB12-B1b TaxID=2705012 RepID=UPI0015F8A742|nr:ABC transporter ATP-binding protein [Streptacidiphilus sp. PB12-B1b]QMU77608.1 ABC transporter ATP-binding protein [Streptacidiphilus sp. PB12-B1b]
MSEDAHGAAAVAATDAAPAAPADGVLLRATGLTRHFQIGGAFSRRTLHAVDDAELTIGRNEIVALAGESGSGKSTVARLLAMVYQPTAGEIHFDGTPLSALRSRKSRLAYRSQAPMVFQDPFSSINPVYRISHGILRSLTLHRPELDKEARTAEAERLLTVVGLTPAATYMNKYPYEMSGGQRQRVGFAQALASNPKLIIADEPVSMLDASIRIGLLNLMAELRDRSGVSFLYITHDLASARYAADRLVVMYAGHIVEQGPIEDILAEPRHPYTQLLLATVPDPRAPLSELAGADRGEPPRVVDPAPGCRFRARCPLAVEQCATVTPPLRLLGDGHQVACHLAESVTATTWTDRAAQEPDQQSAKESA